MVVLSLGTSDQKMYFYLASQYHPKPVLKDIYEAPSRYNLNTIQSTPRPNPCHFLASVALGHILDTTDGTSRRGHCAPVSSLSMISIGASILTCGSGLVLARDCIAAHIVKVPDLVQLATRAAEIHLRAVHLR